MEIPMTIKHLRIFVTVYQEGNVTRAASLLHMTQPAVTRSIQELENHYGIRLFERINHKLYRTKRGEDLYARALHILDSFDDLEKEFQNWDELGILRVGASITLGSILLPKLIQAFSALHPGLQIKATVSNTAAIQQGILDNTLDIALIEGTTSSEYICSDFLAKDSLRLIVPPGHPLSRKDRVSFTELSAYPILLRENGSAGRIFLDHIFAFHGLSIEPAWESVSTQALINAVAAGLGISILPERLVKPDIDAGHVATINLTDENFIRQNYIIWHRQKYLTATTEEFISLCKEMA